MARALKYLFVAYIYVVSMTDTFVCAHNSNLCFPALFQFGDSLSDTGNAAAIFPLALTLVLNPPYGQKAFHPPTGRFSDGFLVIDYLAQHLGIPLLSPYLRSVGANYRQGVDFAFAGATVLNASFYSQQKVATFVPFSLQDEYGWYLKFQRDVDAACCSVCSAALLPDGTSIYAQALYVVGEMGGNDYTILRLSGSSPSTILQTVPAVVDYIGQTIQNLYASGARKFLVPNIPILGCTPLYLTLFGPTSQNYDEYGCLSDDEKITALHNNLLTSAVKDLSTQLPGALIIVADYHAVVVEVLKKPVEYGISSTNLLRACCGGGGKYNYNPQAPCGSPASSTCADPSHYIFWDEFHFTDQFNYIVANAYLSSNSHFVDPQGAFAKCN
ncbi:hypothetical protein O6H91_Y100300 [Diphasiastrum complanatum]|nr:hypothetical protein O6H91_Y100300 [Diphasiastrum complanatum]